MFKNGVRNSIDVKYNTTLPVIFGVKKYADSLMEIVKKRNIELNTRINLIEVDYKNNLAIFENLDEPEKLIQFNVKIKTKSLKCILISSHLKNSF